MRRLSWVIQVSLIQSRESLQAENLSWLCSEGDMTTEERSERYVVGFEDGVRCHEPSLGSREKARK